MSEIPADIVEASKQAERVLMRAPFPDGGWQAIAKALMVEREKAEKLADSMYLTGVHDAYVLAKNHGWQDFAERLVRETNERAKRSGLPKLEV